MTITITLKGVLLTAIAILAIVLLIYLILLLKQLIDTMKKVDGVLEDAKKMTEISASKAEQIDGIIDGLGDTVGTVVDTLKGNQNIIAAITNIVNAFSSLTGIVKKTDCVSKKKKVDN